MTGKFLYRRILIMLLVVSLMYSGYFVYNTFDKSIPDEIFVYADDEEQPVLSLPVGASIGNDRIIETVRDGQDFTLKCRLFGIIDFKEIDVHVIERQEVIPCGFQAGVYLSAKGILVVDVTEVQANDGLIYEPSLGKIYKGDYIVSLDNIPVTSKEQFSFLLSKYGDDKIKLTLDRDGSLIEVSVKPVLDKDYLYRLGIWVRDDLQGIGTVTYVTKDRHFAALGHGISDSDTGKLLDADEGKLYTAHIWGIKKGICGSPGGLCGIINYGNDNIIGEITANTDNGIFGIADDGLMEKIRSYSSMPIGLKQQIEKAPAYIRCEIDGEINDYEIRIDEININDKGNKGIEFEVTDKKILRKTNGIVQGMSGSPIIQNGRIIGAVTHVLVNDPTSGYGIFVENMLSNN